jgi:hypothetical protein
MVIISIIGIIIGFILGFLFYIIPEVLSEEKDRT